MLVQRINWLYPGHESGVDFYLKMAEKYPKSFDEIWVTTLSGFPSLEKHEECANWFSNIAKSMKKLGKKVSLQLANSIGHGDMMGDEFDCSALADNPNVAKLVGEDGTVAQYCFCWNNEAFREYSYKEVAIYAKIVQPDKFWIDDDFRARGHAPVTFGCFCPDCIRKFNAKYGFNFDRESLVKKILSSDTAYREKWIDFIREGLRSYMRGMCEAVHTVSPDTDFGYQNCNNGSYTGYGFKYLFDEMKAVNGKKPHYRAGAGFYNDHNPNLVLEKGIKLAYQHSLLPYHGVLSPEIECVPNTAYGKTVAGILLETSHYLAMGADDMTYNAMDDINDPFEWHEKKFEIFEKMRQYWEKLGNVSKRTYAYGLNYVVSKQAYNKPLKENATMMDMNEESATCAWELIRDGLPIVYDESEDNVRFLHPEIAKIISKDEFEDLKKRKVITCGESIAILNSRGFNVGFDSVKEKKKGELSEIYENNPINGNKQQYFVECYYTQGRFDSHVLSALPKNAIILGRYKHRLQKMHEIDGKVATAIIPMSEGGEWAVFGYSLFKPVKNIAERDRILNVYDYLASTACARILSSEQASINVRNNEKGVVAVSITNCSIGKQEKVKVFVKNPVSDKAVVWGQYIDKCEAHIEKQENGIVVTIPYIEPWSVVTIFFD